jgi:hypothetical protein
MIMLYSDYSENGVITSCIPTIKRAEKKLVSAVNDDSDEDESELLNGGCEAKALGGRQENSLRTVR